MKINKIKINSYGKLKDKEINIDDGINIIYGENEAGKSTLLRFIVNSFYGISKNKKGKEYSDFERYTPWIGEDFSGKIEYQLDNNKKIEIFRDFKKKNPKIFNENMEEISKEFNIDKTKGNEFFYEQTKVDEELFLSTVVVGQQEVKLEKQEQNILLQKISNLVGTGDDNVSYKKAIDRINRKQLDEVGSQRTREKPINILQRDIENLKQRKSELEYFQQNKIENDEKENNIKIEIQNLENKINFIKEIRTINEKENIEKEKIKIKENIKDKNEEKIDLIKNNINEIEIKNKNILEGNNEKNNKKINKEKDKLNKKTILLLSLIIIINILQFIIIKNKIINYIFLITVPATLVYLTIMKNKLNRKIKKQEEIEKNNLNNLEKINNEINNLENEINLLEINNNELNDEIINLKNNFNLKINLEKEKIKNNYKNKIDKNDLDNLIQLDNINLELDNLQNEINNKKVALHTLKIEKENTENNLEELSKIEEELVNDNNKMVNLEKNNASMNLAKEVITKAYEKMKNTVTPKFTEELSKNISNITDGKYSNIMFNDQEGIIVELDNGNYVSASKLSIGTIDQLYLSLRLSMIEELSQESMPVILDEAFAYYDNKRLENILRYISNKFSNHQIIIFTCTNREKEILKELNISYNLATL